MNGKKKIAMVDDKGRFHCECGASHGRGAVNGVDVYRCMKCGKTFGGGKKVILR